ncbi:MAG: hypothetical protein E7531_03880 [Ruminococcaceae bacterium]|nr:hypothetical protein [Oscillospiraceae bacterium]MEE1198034.1 hypothetical protein [Acutalibacteraceae bacterium]
MSEFLTYKGKPLVRKGNEIYYGDMSEKYVIKLEILSTKKEGDLEAADKVKVLLLLSDTELSYKSRIVKTSEKTGLYEAMDIGAIWLERELKKNA